MTARSIGQLVPAVAGLQVKRSSQPVRRDSRYAGEREHQVWKRIHPDRREARRILAARLKAAEFYDRHNKEPGKKNGPLGHVALEVLRELYRMVDYKSGCLEPAIATICEKVRRSRAAVVAALARLKAHGFLVWVRRSEPTNNEGAGPQVRQITNAYGVLSDLPRSAAAWVAKILGKGPTPDCEAARRDQDRAETDVMLDRATPEEQGRFYAGETSTGDVLTRMARFFSSSASSVSGQKPDHG